MRRAAATAFAASSPPARASLEGVFGGLPSAQAASGQPPRQGAAGSSDPARPRQPPGVLRGRPVYGHRDQEQRGAGEHGGWPVRQGVRPLDQHADVVPG
ncbi:hypothetical protein [Acrocarpospora corrugata]|uniref:hypothetical protein n=1 Tax=Acrocarpospora corrugata TaxID=35763 RepID=UPI0012D2C339|nr:hypothetical protein [Acrocarpospora corrugata]